ncbi:MAG: phage integrase N-terminal SAM-like domain-containing protein [Thermoanaerobaculia bacterium]|jgi:hypothetical protein
MHDAIQARPPRLLDRVGHAIRVRQYSIRTEEAYVAWIRRYIVAHGKRHPSSMGAEEVNALLTHLAVDGDVSAQSQALSALLVRYHDVLDEPLPWLGDVVRARRPKRLSVVLSRDEVCQVSGRITRTTKLVAAPLHGGGSRLLEELRLRAKDLDFVTAEIVVWREKGDTDGCDIGRIRELMGRAAVKTMISTRVLNKGGNGVRSSRGRV